MTGEHLRQKLREETHAVHERLHQHRHFAAIADGSIRSVDFDPLMARMGAFYAALDPLMTAASRDLGQGAYRYQPRAVLFPSVEGAPPHFPRIDTLPAFAGAAYVVDGSVLGGQLLRRAISGRLCHPYWDWCAVAGPDVWRSTRALIDLADSCPDRDDAVKTANAVFQVFSDHMVMTDAGVAA